MDGRSRKRREWEHDNEGRKDKRDIWTKFIEDDSKDDRKHKGEKRKFDGKMAEDHKAQIVELEARAPGTPEVDKESRAQPFRLTSM